ncbi:hypothetical protein ACFL2Q_19470, partial [Thermodesulfobacteriota bacterium]
PLFQTKTLTDPKPIAGAQSCYRRTLTTGGSPRNYHRNPSITTCGIGDDRELDPNLTPNQYRSARLDEPAVATRHQPGVPAMAFSPAGARLTSQLTDAIISNIG